MAYKTARCTCPADGALVFLGHLRTCPEVNPFGRERPMPLEDIAPDLSPEQRDGLSCILQHVLTSYGVSEDRSAHVLAEFESCVDGWVGGSFTPPAALPLGEEK